MKLSVLDSTDPNTVSTYTHALDPARTLFLVSSKSGTTVETLSLFKHFYNQVAAMVETYDVGRHFVAITDPEVHLHLDDPYEIGEQFFLWEMATALAAYRLEINPFDQPNVEAAKQRTRDAVKTFSDTGALPDEGPAAMYDGMRLYGSVTADSPEAALNAFLAQSAPGDYVALQAYLPLSIDVDLTDQPSPELSMRMRETTEIHALLLSICGRIRDQYRLAATFGYGPRYLHSTGQLHKGDAGQGLFIQFTADAPDDVPIPDAAGDMAPAMRFSTLEASQAIGDRQALQDAGRRIVRFHLDDRVVEGLRRLNQSLL